MASLCLFAAAVQYNDPIRSGGWRVAALTCVLSLARRLPRLVPVLAGLSAPA
jgi:hypothetical protein